MDDLESIGMECHLYVINGMLEINFLFKSDLI